MSNVIKGEVTSDQDLLAKLTTYENLLKKWLSSKENLQRQKAGEDIIEKWGHVPAPASRSTWHLQPHSSAITDKDTRKGFWNFCP